jgi:hypothetical protein
MKNLTDETISNWAAEAEHLLLQRYKINFELAGFSTADIQHFYSPKQTPAEFVEWLAQKHQLFEFDEY